MDNITFSKEELERYSRHLIIPEFNIEGQKKLKSAKVLVIGTGGLGSPLLLYLAAAGVGTLGLVDFDIVDDSNLQRQVLFTLSDVGKPKVEAAKNRLLALNPFITIKTYQTKFTSENALDIIKEYDVVADGTDNFATRYLVNDACVMAGKPNIYGSIFRFDGQVSVFNYTDSNGVTGPNYRDLFPTPPPPGLVPSCAEGGVLGVLPGIIGSLQANEVIKVITGIGEPLSGRLFLFDAATFQTHTVKLFKDPKAAPITELIDYDQFCNAGGNEKANHEIKEITVTEFNELKQSGEPYQLIDVRETYEFEIVEIGGQHIPLQQIVNKADKIANDRKVIVHCRSGARSRQAIEKLEGKFGYNNLYNLKGGILAWIDQIDTSLPKY